MEHSIEYATLSRRDRPFQCMYGPYGDHAIECCAVEVASNNNKCISIVLHLYRAFCLISHVWWDDPSPYGIVNEWLKSLFFFVVVEVTFDANLR